MLQALHCEPLTLVIKGGLTTLVKQEIKE